tara:strand:+ start:183 stop:797 length:615 start_codon:yes stop_codon:yes gene_type:complete
MSKILKFLFLIDQNNKITKYSDSFSNQKKIIIKSFLVIMSISWFLYPEILRFNSPQRICYQSKIFEDGKEWIYHRSCSGYGMDKECFYSKIRLYTTQDEINCNESIKKEKLFYKKYGSWIYLTNYKERYGFFINSIVFGFIYFLIWLYPTWLIHIISKKIRFDYSVDKSWNNNILKIIAKNMIYEGYILWWLVFYILYLGIVMP